MRIDQLRFFTAIYECKSINKAAIKLERSVQNLSYALQSLEDELNVPLLIRSYHGVIPTEAGKKLYSIATDIIASLDHFMLDLSQNDHNQPLPIRINKIIAPVILSSLNSYISHNKLPITLVVDKAPLPEIKFLNSPISILLYTESQAASFQSLFPDYQFINIVEIDFDFLMNTNHPLADKQIIKASDLIAATDANFNNEDIIYGMNITDNISYNLKYPFQYTYTFSKPSTIPFEELAFLRHNNLALSYSLSIKNCSFLCRALPKDVSDVKAISYEYPYCNLYAILYTASPHYEANLFLTEILQNHLC